MIPTPTRLLSIVVRVVAVLTVIVGVATFPMRGFTSAALFVGAGVFLYISGGMQPRRWRLTPRGMAIGYFAILLVAQSSAA